MKDITYRVVATFKVERFVRPANRSKRFIIRRQQWHTCRSAALLVWLLLMFGNTNTVAQETWQPHTRLWGVFMDKLEWPLSDGRVLIGLAPGPNSESNKFEHYDVATLSTSSMPLGLMPALGVTSQVGDVNGDGIMDAAGKELGTTEQLIVLSPYTDSQRVQLYKREGYPLVGSFDYATELASSHVDCDRDGILDVFDMNSRDDIIRISYGDSNADTLWSAASEVPYVDADKETSDCWRSEVLCTGLLSGVPCFLKVDIKSDQLHESCGDSVVYKLVVLDTNDLRARKSRIATQTIAEYYSRVGHGFFDFIINFDDVWHLPRADGAPYTLRVTLQGMDIHEPHASFSHKNGRMFTATSCFGQGKGSGDRCRMDGSKVFLAQSFTRINGLLPQWSTLNRVTDPWTLQTENLGTMPFHDGISSDETEVGGTERILLIPDIDGDGREDVLAHYYAPDPETQKRTRVVDLFLSTEQPTVNVAEEPDFTTNTTATAEVIDGGWRIGREPVCLSSETVPVYTITGEQVATLQANATNDAIIITSTPQLPRVALWARVCEQYYRLP